MEVSSQIHALPLYPWGIAPEVQWMESWVGFAAYVNTVDKMQIYSHVSEIEL
jgi:hypothetical protein